MPRVYCCADAEIARPRTKKAKRFMILQTACEGSESACWGKPDSNAGRASLSRTSLRPQYAGEAKIRRKSKATRAASASDGKNMMRFEFYRRIRTAFAVSQTVKGLYGLFSSIIFKAVFC